MTHAEPQSQTPTLFRCKACGCLWRKNSWELDEAYTSWSLADAKAENDALKHDNSTILKAAGDEAALVTELQAEIARKDAALKAVTDHFADVMAGPMIAGHGVTFANGVAGIPTIKAARAALAPRKDTPQ